MSCGCDNFFYLTRVAKIGRAARPQKPCDNTGPTCAFIGRWWKAGAGSRGGIIRFGGGGGGDDGHKAKEMFFLCIVRAHKHAFAAKKTKAKIARCSSMSKFCPPAAASCKSKQRNHTSGLDVQPMGGGGGGGGGGGTGQNWRSADILFLGFVFERAGSSLQKKGGRQQDRNSGFG